MSQAHLVSREVQCDGKVPYLTKPVAKRAVVDMEQKGRGRMKPYRCPWCGCWHIGHRPRQLSPGSLDD